MERAGVQRTCLKKIKTIYNSQHQTKWGQSESDPTEIKNKTRLSTLSTSIQYSTWGSSKNNKKMKGEKVIQIRNEKVKLSLLVYDRIHHMNDPPKFYQVTSKTH